MKPWKKVKPDPADQAVDTHFRKLVFWVFVIQVEEGQQSQS
jgi:hypothetical protein